MYISLRRRAVLLGTLLIVSLFALTTHVHAWTGPTAAPPNNNVSAPVNVGSAGQVKAGDFSTQGKLGAGTVSPSASYQLDVYKAGWKAYFHGTDGGISIGPLNSGWAHIYSDAGNAQPFIFNTDVYTTTNGFSSYDSDLLLKTVGTTRVTVLNSNGNVGIGTASPAGKLDVNGTIRNVSEPNYGPVEYRSWGIYNPSGNIYMEPSPGSTFYIVPSDWTTNLTTRIKGTLCINDDCKSAWPSGSISGSGTAGYDARWTNGTTLGNSAIYSDGGGNVAIGTTGFANYIGWPGSLNVNGNMRAAKYYDDDTNYYVDLNAGANVGGVWYFSDIRPSVIYDRDNTGYYLDMNNGSNVNSFTGNEIYTNNWFRVNGSGGIYWQQFGGGWYMQDSTWIRSYNGRYVYMNPGFDTGGASAVGCGGALGAGYTFRVCGSQNVTSSVTTPTLCLGGDCRSSWPTTSSLDWGSITNKPGNLAFWDTWYGSAYLGSNGDLYMGWDGRWLSQTINQDVRTNAVVRFARTYDDDTNYYIDSNVDSQMNTVYANAFYYRSDERLKKNIQPLGGALDTVLKLDGVSFDWKDGSGERQIGFIAQDVEKVVPELVSTNPETGIKAVDYSKVGPLLVNALKEQERKIEDQQRQIDELRSEIEALRK